MFTKHTCSPSQGVSSSMYSHAPTCGCFVRLVREVSHFGKGDFCPSLKDILSVNKPPSEDRKHRGSIYVTVLQIHLVRQVNTRTAQKKSHPTLQTPDIEYLVLHKRSIKLPSKRLRPPAQGHCSRLKKRRKRQEKSSMAVVSEPKQSALVPNIQTTRWPPLAPRTCGLWSASHDSTESPRRGQTCPNFGREVSESSSRSEPTSSPAGW